MKKSFFPVILAALVLLSTSCIKNVESDGVKAVRTGQAALLTAQATAATTKATADAAVSTATAALTNAQAATELAKAAATTATSAAATALNAATIAGQTAATAIVTENLRHTAAVNAADEALRVATDATAKAKAADALAQENANNVVELAKIDLAKQQALANVAKDKATSDAAAAKLTNDNAIALLKAQTDLAAAQTVATQAAAKLKNSDAEFYLVLKATNLSNLANDYQTAAGNVDATELILDALNVTLINDKQSKIDQTAAIADSTTIKAAKKAIVDTKAAYVTAQATTVSAKADLATATALEVSTKAIMDGAPLEVIKTQWLADSVKERGIYNAFATKQLLNNISRQNPDSADVVVNGITVKGIWNKAIDATATAQNDTVAKAALKATAALNVANQQVVLANAQNDTLAAFTAYYITPSWMHKDNGTNVGLVSWSMAVISELTESSVTLGVRTFNSSNDYNEWQLASTQAAVPLATITAKRKAVSDAQTALGTLQGKLTTAVSDLAKSKQTYNTALIVSSAYSKRKDALNAINDALVISMAGSMQRMVAIHQLIVWIDAMDSKAVPSSTDIAYKTAKENHDAAVIALAKATVALNGDPLATPIITGAIADETSAKSAWQGAIAALPIVIDSYTRQTPLDQQAIAYLSTQIDDLTQRIAAQTQILAQEKVVVDYWLAQIKIALKD